jgi:CheY-like chemotaxis protein
MLSFSRRQQLSPSTFPLDRLSKSVDGLVAPVLGGRVKIRWKIEQGLWPAYVDPGQLDLAVMNLVINARDAMPDGGIIGLWARNETIGAQTHDLSPGDYVVLCVEDTGLGISPELLPKVMEPFFTTKEVGHGTGLGLSTVYGFARQSGGTLRIQSMVGKGTTVELWLPRSRATADSEQPHRTASPRTTVQPSAQPSILLVDDSGELRELTRQLLADQGFDVSTAGGGAEALALLEKEPDRFDMIVTDFAMPLVSGLEVIRLARNIRAEWPAIMISGYADAAAIADRPSDVMVLQKPFEIGQLVTAVEQAWTKANRNSRGSVAAAARG